VDIAQSDLVSLGVDGLLVVQSVLQLDFAHAADGSGSAQHVGVGLDVAADVTLELGLLQQAGQLGNAEVVRSTQGDFVTVGSQTADGSLLLGNAQAGAQGAVVVCNVTADVTADAVSSTDGLLFVESVDSL
jgi:hypothetical protein